MRKFVLDGRSFYFILKTFYVQFCSLGAPVIWRKGLLNIPRTQLDWKPRHRAQYPSSIKADPADDNKNI
jgi:hypothetical protein